LFCRFFLTSIGFSIISRLCCCSLSFLSAWKLLMLIFPPIMGFSRFHLIVPSNFRFFLSTLGFFEGLIETFVVFAFIRCLISFWLKFPLNYLYTHQLRVSWTYFLKLAWVFLFLIGLVVEILDIWSFSFLIPSASQSMYRVWSNFSKVSNWSFFLPLV